MGQVQPSGRVNRDGIGLELIVSRRFPAPAAEAWEWVASPAKVKQWFGAVKGRPAVGAVLSVKLMAEEGSPSEELVVLECTPGRRYVVETVVGDQLWHLHDLGRRPRRGIHRVPRPPADDRT